MFQLWSEKWLDSTEVLLSLESVLRSSGAVVRRGGDYDSWDMEIRGGLFGGVRVRTVSENYGPRKHIVRLCSRSEEHTSELQSQSNLVCRLLLEKKNHLALIIA